MNTIYILASAGIGIDHVMDGARNIRQRTETQTKTGQVDQNMGGIDGYRRIQNTNTKKRIDAEHGMSCFAETDTMLRVDWPRKEGVL